MSNKIIRQVSHQPPSRIIPAHGPAGPKTAVQDRAASFGTDDPAAQIKANRAASDKANRGKMGKPISSGY